MADMDSGFIYGQSGEEKVISEYRFHFLK